MADLNNSLEDGELRDEVSGYASDSSSIQILDDQPKLAEISHESGINLSLTPSTSRGKEYGQASRWRPRGQNQISHHLEQQLQSNLMGEEEANHWTNEQRQLMSPALMLKLKKQRKNRQKSERRALRQQHIEENLTTVVSDPLPIWISLKRTPWFYIESGEQLQWMIGKLSGERVFAFDVEMTIYTLNRQKFKKKPTICLMQISTRGEDFLVDPLVLKQQMVLLHGIFGDRNIMKVVHGDRDAKLLEEQFGIHTRPLYDTSTGGSRKLQHLVYQACGVKLDKQLTFSDWTIRPLSQEMIDYARADTHYLLRCFDFLHRRY